MRRERLTKCVLFNQCAFAKFVVAVATMHDCGFNSFYILHIHQMWHHQIFNSSQTVPLHNKIYYWNVSYRLKTSEHSLAGSLTYQFLMFTASAISYDRWNHRFWQNTKQKESFQPAQLCVYRRVYGKGVRNFTALKNYICP